ncbi:MAG: 50S ribosome-binding GTPase, partial [Planctomycetes bacterium]|nr:50S ribosome-binding GTPase [Planctomycetota bacterium]
SYTGDDLVELHIPGSLPLVQAALEAWLSAGARPARAGEFTRRAFLAGKIDLSQAEAVCALIRASDEASRRRTAAVLSGGLSRRIGEFLDRLRSTQALLVASVDFSDQELGDETLARARESLEGASRDLDSLVATASEELAGDRGIRVLFAGRANAGKSALFNRLLGEERAIVTDVPGTTRDLIEGDIEIDGVRLVLVDGAGERGPGERRSGADRAAEARAESARESADLVIHVVDGTGQDLDLDRDLRERLQGPVILAINKTDLPACDPERVAREFGTPDAVAVSARTDAGADVLRRRLAALALVSGDAALAVNARQKDALARAASSCREALHALSSLEHGPEFASVDVQDAMGALGEIVGDVTPDEVLDLVFGQFCVGK